jgi:hypothetical protein
MTRQATVTRHVAADYPHNHLGRNAAEGEVFYVFTGPTYGAVDTEDGIALSERPGEGPFFEFPRDAVEIRTERDLPYPDTTRYPRTAEETERWIRGERLPPCPGEPPCGGQPSPWTWAPEPEAEEDWPG